MYDSTTIYKNNSLDSSKLKGCNPQQISCNLTGMKPVLGYYSFLKLCG